MRGTCPTDKASTELGRYLRSEYGEEATFARALIAAGRRPRRVVIRNADGGLVRRFLVAVTDALGAGSGVPEGA